MPPSRATSAPIGRGTRWRSRSATSWAFSSARSCASASFSFSSPLRSSRRPSERIEGSPVMSPAAFFARPVILSMMLMGVSYPIGCGRNSRTALDGRARAGLHRQAGLDPVGLALRVLAHIRVAESDQLVRRDLGVPAGEARAVGDDCGVLVWQQLGRLRLELLVVNADRAGDVLLGEAI